MNTKSIMLAREEVWYCLSELFLDTEITEDDQKRIAQSLASTCFSEAELHSIMVDEVAPVMCTNLQVIGGEWAFFERDTVIEKISSRLDALQNRPARGWFPFLYLRRAWCMAEVSDDWKSVLGKVAKIRAASQCD